jgi:hypothetical protein
VPADLHFFFVFSTIFGFVTSLCHSSLASLERDLVVTARHLGGSRMKKRVLSVFAAIALAGCASSSPPSNIADACAIMDEKSRWEDHVFDAARDWQVSPGVILAFIRQESSFRRDARPKDRDGRLLSSAFGYSQALDSTWADYERARGGAKRKSFGDSSDFIGWYLDLISRRTGLSKSDARNLYLAYHEGPSGFQRHTYRNKPWLGEVASRVSSQAAIYDGQLRRCEARQMRKLASN